MEGGRDIWEMSKLWGWPSCPGEIGSTWPLLALLVTVHLPLQLKPFGPVLPGREDKETQVQHGNEAPLTQFKFTGEEALFYQINCSKRKSQDMSL